MSKGNGMSFVKGMGAGMVAGAAAVIVGKAMMQDKGTVSKGTAKIAKAVGEFAQGVQTMFR